MGRREGRGAPALASPLRSLWTVSPLAVRPVMLCLALQADAPHGGLQEAFVELRLYLASPVHPGVGVLVTSAWGQGGWSRPRG